MSNNSNTLYNNLFPTLISDIKSYTGLDPLLPWLRGIRKMKETLPPQLLKEKLPRFLQKCSETFLTDRRYSNDMRFLRVWLQLMDFVDDPKHVLATMERNRVGAKKSLFYQAYALYYEKMKKFDAAEKIYHLGVQNLAEPADELQKSYEQFLHRMGRHKNKRIQGGKTNSGHGSLNHDKVRECKNDMPIKDANHNHIGLLNDQFSRKVTVGDSVVDMVKVGQDKNRKFRVDDTINPDAEDVRHHGLVEPTINTKEAMSAINSMFSEPIESSIAPRKSTNNPKSGFNIFTDESSETEEPFEIYVDGEETNEKCIQTHTVFAKPNDFVSEGVKDPNPKRSHHSGLREDTVVYRFVGSTISDEPRVENVCHHGLVDPTVNLKEAMEDINGMFGKPIDFVRKSRTKRHEKAPDMKGDCGGFLILADDEPENKNAKETNRTKRHEKAPDMNGDCGGFLILADDEPENKNAKETSRTKRHEKAPDVNGDCGGFLILADEEPENTNAKETVPGGFLILPDDELDNQGHNDLPSTSTGKRSDLFEQTVCTKEAMDEINKLFAMPMDF